MHNWSCGWFSCTGCWTQRHVRTTGPAPPRVRATASRTRAPATPPSPKSGSTSPRSPSSVSRQHSELHPQETRDPLPQICSPILCICLSENMLPFRTSELGLFPDDDFKFSTTKGAKRIPFASAGDCYSAGHCPQVSPPSQLRDKCACAGSMLLKARKEQQSAVKIVRCLNRADETR